MKALDRKLLRDLRLMWSQALTIALVVGSGIGGFIMTLSAVDSVARARDAYYVADRFADVFVSVKRAPLSLVETLRSVPGVADVQATVEMVVRVEREGQTDPIIGQLIGLDPRHPQRLNRVTLRSGRMLSDAAAGERPGDGAMPALVNEGFAAAHGLQPGARLTALLNGKRRTLVVTGFALSPEYIFAGIFGMPDQRGYGVFWVDAEALAAAFDMEGAFNRVAVRLAPLASERDVMDALTRRLAAYGAREAIGRKDQVSHAMLDNEIKEQHVLGTVLPSISLAVAAFLLNVVISRLVATQREQIAALKALGYGNRAVAAHYLKLVLAIVAIGLAFGVWLGDRLGTMLTGIYAEFFRFPSFEHHIAPWLLVVSVALSVGTAVLGTLNAIAATVRLTPAEAMRPPAPGRYRPALLERGVDAVMRGADALWRRCGRRRDAVGVSAPRQIADGAARGTMLRMILRNIERRPWRSTLAVAGVAAAVAIVVMGNFFRDAIEVIVDTQFRLVMRNDVAIWTTEPVDDSARLAFERLPGVSAVESSRFVAVVLVNGHRRERNQIRGYATRPELYRIIDVDNREHVPDGDGLVLTDRLAAKLSVRAGDRLQVELLEGRARTLELPVDAVVTEMWGLNVYMNREALNRALGEADLSSGFSIAVERGREAELLRASMQLPRVAGAFSKATMLRNMEEISARNIRIMSTVLTLLAAVIAVGVVYNNARIALAERAWELASLRVLGFSRAEVSALLLGEMALVIAIALPIGMALGDLLVHAVAELLKSDQFHFPVTIRARTYAWAAIAVLAAGIGSALIVRRRIDQLDMVAALKTRE